MIWGFEKVKPIYKLRFAKYDLLNGKKLLDLKQNVDRNSKS